VGEYFTDKLTLGSLSIKNQTMGLFNSSAFPFSDFGVGPPNQQDGRRTGTFPQYSSFLESLVEQGTYDSASFSLWLDPAIDASDNANEFPSGVFAIGGIDTGLSNGPFTTLPVVADNSTTVVAVPQHWTLALSALNMANGNTTNLVKEPVSCVLSTGAAVPYLPEEVFKNLVAQFPEAVLNATSGLYIIPCSERLNSSKSVSFTLADPRYIGADKDSQLEVTFTVPAAEAIWPAAKLVKGSDPNACGIAAFSAAVTPEDLCQLGVSVLRNGIWVFDSTNAEISFAPAAPKGSKHSKLVRIPRTGVKGLHI
jgi:hypothetical protein